MQAPLSRPIITLTTDFGLKDHYVGTVKGVILGRCPEAHLVDISHQIPAFSIFAGAYSINQAAPYFPEGTIHVVVIDPGVGTERKPLLVQAIGQYFIAPDNGVLSMIAARAGKFVARELTNRDLWLQSPSATFHGRDIFAPVAAALASGTARPEEVGPVLTRVELLAGSEPSESPAGVWNGTILSIDHFGNVITNFTIAAFSRITDRRFSIEVGHKKIKDFEWAFGDAQHDRCFAYFGSSGFIELGINQSNAAKYLHAAPGDPVILRPQT